MRIRTLVFDHDGLPGGDDNEGGIVEGVDVHLELDAREVGCDAVLADFEGAGGKIAIEDGAVLDDIDGLGSSVSHSGGDLDVVDGVDISRGLTT